MGIRDWLFGRRGDTQLDVAAMSGEQREELARKGSAAFAAGKHAKAAKLLGSIHPTLGDEEGSSVLRMQFALTLCRLERYDEAIQVLHLISDPDDELRVDGRSPLEVKAMALHETGDGRGTWEDCHKILETRPFQART